MPFSRSRAAIVKNANKIEFYSPILVSNENFLFEISSLKQKFEPNVQIDVLGNVFATKLIKEGDFLLKFDNKIDDVDLDKIEEARSIKMFYNNFNVTQRLFDHYKKENVANNEGEEEIVIVLKTEKYSPVLLLESDAQPLSLQFVLSTKKIEKGEKIFKINSLFDEIDQFSFASMQFNLNSVLKIYQV